VLPAWDGSKTALAGSKSGFGREGNWRFRPYIGLAFRNRHWQSPRPVPQKASQQPWCTAMKKLRIVILKFGTARQKIVLE
jgi:hypothetical protein